MAVGVKLGINWMKSLQAEAELRRFLETSEAKAHPMAWCNRLLRVVPRGGVGEEGEEPVARIRLEPLVCKPLCHRRLPVGQDVTAYGGGIAGAVPIDENRRQLAKAGFAAVEVIATAADQRTRAATARPRRRASPWLGRATVRAGRLTTACTAGCSTY